MRKLCNEMKVEIVEAEACPDHIHMLVSIPPYMSVALCFYIEHCHQFFECVLSIETGVSQVAFFRFPLG